MKITVNVEDIFKGKKISVEFDRRAWIAALNKRIGYFGYPMKNPSHPMVKWDGMGLGPVFLIKKSHQRFFVKISYIF